MMFSHFYERFFPYLWREFVPLEDKLVLRTFCTYILLLALTLQSFYRSIMTMEYQIHLPEYLAKCINKDRPQLHCNGQCVLMKKIEEQEKKETKKNLVVYEYSALYVHKEQTIYTLYQPNDEADETPFSPYRIDYTFKFNTSIFRPPIRLSLPVEIA